MRTLYCFLSSQDSFRACLKRPGASGCIQDRAEKTQKQGDRYLIRNRARRIEVMFILGTTFIEYIAFGLMINNGTFQTMMTASASEVSGQLQSSIDSLAYTVTSFRFNVLQYRLSREYLLFFSMSERRSSCSMRQEIKKFWLYPLAILLHTVMDTVAALSIFKVIDISSWALEAYVAAIGL